MERSNRPCSCGSGKIREPLYDAAGIFCCYTCDDCEDDKRLTYRSDIFTDPNYWSDEEKDSD